MVRKLAFGVIAASVIVFGVSFMFVLTSDNGAWGFGIPLSLFTFVAGILTVQLSVPGFTRTQGPKSFAALDVSGAFSSPVKHRVDRRARTWTRTWMNIYFWVGLGEVFLGGLFLAVGVAGSRSGATAADHQLAWTGFGVGGILGAIGVACLYVCYRTYNKDKLHTTGVDGKATIVGVTQTGMWANNNPVTVLDCKIHVDGHPDYEVRHRETVPQVAIGQLTSGATLPVKVNPKNPSDFIIQWEQL